LERVGILGAIVSAGSAIANYKAGNISGAHATAQVAIAIIGAANPVAGLILSAVDTFFGIYL
jgi:hypothetical protein